MNNPFNQPARLAAIMIAGLCIPSPAQDKQQKKQPPTKAAQVVELHVAGMT
jgi:hypothetical protein